MGTVGDTHKLWYLNPNYSLSSSAYAPSSKMADEVYVNGNDIYFFHITAPGSNQSSIRRFNKSSSLEVSAVNLDGIYFGFSVSNNYQYAIAWTNYTNLTVYSLPDLTTMWNYPVPIVPSVGGVTDKIAFSLDSSLAVI